MKIGTAISKVATPIAGALKLGCYDPLTRDLRPESPCAKARKRTDEARNIREFSSAIYDRFFSKTDNQQQPKGNEMQFIISKQILVEAGTAEEAFAKEKEGKTIGVNVRLRPEPEQPPKVDLRAPAKR